MTTIVDLWANTALSEQDEPVFLGLFWNRRFCGSNPMEKVVCASAPRPSLPSQFSVCSHCHWHSPWPMGPIPTSRLESGEGGGGGYLMACNRRQLSAGKIRAYGSRLRSRPVVSCIETDRAPLNKQELHLFVTATPFLIRPLTTFRPVNGTLGGLKGECLPGARPARYFLLTIPTSAPDLPSHGEAPQVAHALHTFPTKHVA